MSEPSSHHPHHLRKPLTFGKKVVTFVRANLITTVLSVLSASWLAISWVVYQVESGVKDANINSFGDSLWWGIVTFLTVGYGDKYPITTPGRVWAGVLMLAGVLAVTGTTVPAT